MLHSIKEVLTVVMCDVSAGENTVHEIYAFSKIKKIALLTNMIDAGPLEIAAIYKKRWKMELYFKKMKQNLHVKGFYRQSENAVKTQIWIALIVHLLFLILKAETRQQDRI